MTVKDLYNWCKAYPHKEAEVYLCKDWEEVDYNGMLTDLYELQDVTYQRNVVDMGMDFKDQYEVILCFADKKADAEIRY